MTGFRKIKCVNGINPKKQTNTNNAAKEGNAEERPDACCKIYGEISGTKYR